MGEQRKGVVALAVACVVWGLSPLYYKLLAAVPPLEVLSHRTLWSLALFGLILLGQGRLREVPQLLRSHGGGVALAAVLISANWFLFILSVQIGLTVQASLGYYIFPLVAVLLGVLAFGERLNRWQGLAVSLAAAAVLVLTFGLGVAPWVALALATTFGLYGLIKKRLVAGPVVSVTAEVLVLAPLAVVWLAGVHGGLFSEFSRAGGWFGHSLGTSLLLAFSGVMTAGPLILFTYASQRVTMATVGLVQYLNPTLQFLCATLVFAEPFSRWHGIAFGLIWAALAIYSWQALVQDRAARSRNSRPGTSATAVK
ncbi:EamA family transporter RarD [Rhodobacter ferrooxidans]|uniref:RarD protein, DMT superfamily transporter n=1 Tax=Rhodobacter ferrooxidans TaxID=371731 RepID=C8RZB6_9RHOB|nr:EamA family transporter RarD [Rhodobacter sp. SW2]EEW26073.1 RarD protein, DMT superfamily transporter [Rhodobacter sp. SW2]